MLREIGLNLDQNIFPLVKNGGVVIPGNSTKPSMIMKKENCNDKPERQNRPATRQRKRTTRWQGKTRQSGKARSATPFFRANLHETYTEGFCELKEAYPGIKIWEQKDGMWLLSQSTLLHGLLHNAVFLCAIPFNPLKRVRGWGFWYGKTWIGPRHTNMPDGSICSFEPSDGTWVPGDSIIKLLDIYTLWAVRHMHLQIFDYWPGAQVAHHAYERLTELKIDELCGCGSLTKTYRDCCRTKDLRRNRLADATKFIFDGGANREPPEAVIEFLKYGGEPPSLQTT